MNHPNRNPLLLQIETQQSPDLETQPDSALSLALFLLSLVLVSLTIFAAALLP